MANNCRAWRKSRGTPKLNACSTFGKFDLGGTNAVEAALDEFHGMNNPGPALFVRR